VGGSRGNGDREKSGDEIIAERVIKKIVAEAGEESSVWFLGSGSMRTDNGESALQKILGGTAPQRVEKARQGNSV